MAEQEDMFPSLAQAATQAPKQKKKKGQKMALDAFLADSTTGGSWADEMEALPTGPTARESGFVSDFGQRPDRGSRDDPRSYTGGSRGDFGDRQAYDRVDRPEVPLPTSPPYTAFVGNVSFETTESDLAGFFGQSAQDIVSIRIVSGPDGKPKGFAYLEFGSLEDLKGALSLSGSSLAGRTVRVSVAEAPKSRYGDDSRAAASSEWRRDGPLPSFGNDRGGDRRSTSRNFDDRPSYVDEDPDRWTAARGSKFVPSATPSQSSFGGGPRRDFSNQSNASERDYSTFERGSKFMPSVSGTSTPSGLDSRRSSSYLGAQAPPGEAETASAWRRATPLPSAPTSPNPAYSTSSSAGPPNVRKRLELAPRSTSQSGSGPSAAPAISPPLPSASSTKINPFGAAAPVNTADREREIEAKLAKVRLEQAEKAAATPVRSSAFASAPNRSSSLEAAKERDTEARPARKEPTRILSNKAREGFSFAAAAGKKDEINGGDEDGKEKESIEAEDSESVEA